MREVMDTGYRQTTKCGQIIFVGSKGSGKSSLYQSLKSPNPHATDVSSCSILVEEWKPFDLECSPVAEECRKCLEGNLTEEDLKAVFQVWDICGYESLWTCQQLCMGSGALFVLVFNIRNPMDAGMVPQWVQMIQAKSLGANIIIAASNCEVIDNGFQKVLAEVEKMENIVVCRIKEELASLRDLKSEEWVRNRIAELDKIVKERPNVCSTVFLTSVVTGKGLSDLRCAILEHLFDVEKFPHIHRRLSVKEMDLVEKIRPMHDGKNMVMSLEDYRGVAASVGLNDEQELEEATEILEMRGYVARLRAAGTFHEPQATIVVTDPCCFAKACAMIHRDEETPQDFVNKLQRSHLMQRFWPTSTRPNDWTLRSAIEDVVDRGMIRESFLPLCWQIWDVNEEDIKKIIAVMVKLGILVNGAPKAGYEIELALSYFKNLSVTKRYYLPLLLKLPKTVAQAVWPDKTSESTVEIGWQYRFQEGLSEGLLLSILAACMNHRPLSTVLAQWQAGLIVRVGDVVVRLVAGDRVLDLNALCKVTNGNKRALNMAWMTLMHYIYVTESFLSNFPGLYYQFSSPSNIRNSPRTIYQLIQDCIAKNENHFEYLWILPPFDINANTIDELSVPSDVLTWAKRLSGQSSIFLSHQSSLKDEVKQLALNLEQFGFDVTLRGEQSEEVSDKTLAIQRCSLVILFLTKLYLEDPVLQDHITEAQNNNKHIIAARFEPGLTCTLANVVSWVNLDSGGGSGVSHAFDPEQLNSLITECQALVYGSGDVAPLSELLPQSKSQPSTESAPAIPASSRMEPEVDSSLSDVKRLKKAEKRVQFSPETASNHDDQIKPLAACAVAAAMVGAAAEHLSLTFKASPAGVRAAAATAKVARAVAHGDADAATQAMSDVVRMVDGLASSAKQKENGFVSPPKSKTCVVL